MGLFTIYCIVLVIDSQRFFQTRLPAIIRNGLNFYYACVIARVFCDVSITSSCPQRSSTRIACGRPSKSQCYLSYFDVGVSFKPALCLLETNLFNLENDRYFTAHYIRTRLTHGGQSSLRGYDGRIDDPLGGINMAPCSCPKRIGGSRIDLIARRHLGNKALYC